MKQILSGVPNSFTFILLIGVLIGGLYVSGAIPPLQSAFGGTTLSLSQISYTDATGLATSKAWRALISYTGTQDNSLIGLSYDSQPTSLLDSFSGKKARDNIKVDSSVTKLSCNYPYSLSNVDQKAYYKLVPLSVTITPNTPYCEAACAIGQFNQPVTYSNGIGPRTNDVCARSYQDTCKAQGNGATYLVAKANSYFFGVNIGSNDKLVCVRYGTDLNKPTLYTYSATSKNPDTNVQYTITNLNTYKTETLNVNPNNLIAVSPDKLVKVTLSGATTSFNAMCPEYSDWYIVKKDTGETSIVPRTTVSTLTPPVISEGAIESDVVTTLNTYNNKLDALFTGVDNYMSQQNSHYDQFSMAQFASSQMSLDRMNKPVVYPQATVELSTDFVGIYEPIAIPVIEKIIPTKVTLTENGQHQKFDVYVRNAGDTGAITVSVPSCTPSGLNTEGGVGRTVAAGAVEDWSIYVWGAKGTYTCNIEAYDSNRNTVAKGTVAVEVGAQCNPGTQPGPDYGLIYNADGSCSWKCQVTSCPSGYHLASSGCGCDKDTPVCTAPATMKSCQYWDDESCVVRMKSGWSIVNGQCSQMCTEDQKCDDGTILAKCEGGILKPTGNKCTSVICTFPEVPVTTTTPSPLSGLPIIGDLFKPTTTQTCMLDPMILTGIVVVVAGTVLIVAIRTFGKKGGKR